MVYQPGRLNILPRYQVGDLKIRDKRSCVGKRERQKEIKRERDFVKKKAQAS
jgi:hypothetical protein